MKFTTGFLAVLAAIPQTFAVKFTNTAWSVVAGQPITLTWADATGPVMISLKNGPSTDLKTVEVIASGETTNSFTWTPEAGLTTDTYAFEIVDGNGVPNYSSQFSFVGSVATTTSESSTTAASTTTATTTSTALTTSTTSSDSSSESSTSSASSTSIVTSTTAKSTTTKTTGTSSSSTTSATATSTTGSNSTNDSKRLGSPLAFILVTAATLMIFS